MISGALIAKRLGLTQYWRYLIAGVVTSDLSSALWVKAHHSTLLPNSAWWWCCSWIGLEPEQDAVGNEKPLDGTWWPTHYKWEAQQIVMSIARLCSQPWTINSHCQAKIFALSSTAIVLQTFQREGLSKTEGGNAFSVSSFQDIAVIPMLAFIPLVICRVSEATGAVTSLDHQRRNSWSGCWSTWLGLWPCDYRIYRDCGCWRSTS